LLVSLIKVNRLIEEKIGNDEKGADMKLWNKNPSLGEVSSPLRWPPDRAGAEGFIARFCIHGMGVLANRSIWREIRSESLSCVQQRQPQARCHSRQPWHQVQGILLKHGTDLPYQPWKGEFRTSMSRLYEAEPSRNTRATTRLCSKPGKKLSRCSRRVP